MTERARIPELDGLRGIAIGMVFIFHYFTMLVHPRHGSSLAYLAASTRLMWSGVDLFFVLSGFLIGGILLDVRASSNYFEVFYVRRFFRIVPIYFCCLIAYIGIVVAVHAGMAARFSYITADRLPFASYIFFIQNFWMAAHNTLGGGGLGVTWSLAVEEQFYLTLPLIIRVVPRRHLMRVLLLGILLSLATRIALYATHPGNQVSWYVLMPCRVDALFLGVLGAVWFRTPSFRGMFDRQRTSIRLALLALGCGVLLLMRFS